MKDQKHEIYNIFPNSIEDYSMSKGEMLDYFSEHEVILSPDLAEEIYSISEGWNRAIDLTRRILEDNPRVQPYIIDIIKTNVMKYIDAIVISDMDNDLVKLLINISLLNHPATSLLTRIVDSSLFSKFKQLSKECIFVLYEEEIDSYRIHPIFSEFLKKKADSVPLDEIHAVLRTAAEWCIEHDYILDALKYYDQLGDYKTFLDIAFDLSLVVPKEIMVYIASTIEKMPMEFLSKDDRGYTLYSRMLMNLGRIDEAVAFIKDKLSEYEKQPSYEYKNRLLFGLNNNLGYISMIQSIYNAKYDFPDYFKTADAYFRLCSYKKNEIELVSFSFGPFVNIVGNRQKGEFKKYIEALKNSVPYVIHHTNGTMSGFFELAISEHAYYIGDMDTCERFAYRSINMAVEKKQYEIENRALYYLLKRCLCSGKIEKVLDVYDKICLQPTKSDYPERYRMMDIIKSWFFAQINQRNHIAYWIKRDVEEEESIFLRRDVDFLIKSKYLLLEGQYQQLLVQLENQESEMSVAAFLLGRIAIYRDRAICYYHLKEYKAAMKAFEEAYRMSRPNAIISVFTEAGNDMRSLCSFALKYDKCKIPGEWLKMINTKSSTYAKRLNQVAALFEQPESIKSISLTKTECSVLTKLSKGMSRQDIAEESKISLNTLKTIIGDAINKLGAHNAIEAVSIAISKGLIG